jgi:hypothetical protein
VCQAPHPNGLGQDYLDCGPLDAHTRAQAVRAAKAWSPGFEPLDISVRCGPSALCSEKGGAAAVWWFEGTPTPLKGRVKVQDLASCVNVPCPYDATLVWR